MVAMTAGTTTIEVVRSLLLNRGLKVVTTPSMWQWSSVNARTLRYS